MSFPKGFTKTDEICPFHAEEQVHIVITPADEYMCPACYKEVTSRPTRNFEDGTVSFMTPAKERNLWTLYRKYRKET